MSSSIQPRDLDAEELPSVSHRALVVMNMRLQSIVHRGVMVDCQRFSGSQITRLSTVHGRRHSSIDHFVCNAPASALLTSPRVDRQTAVADHFVIRTFAEDQGQPPAPRVQPYPPSVSKQPIELLHQLLGFQCNTLRDGWSRLKATATQLERVDGRKQWVKHADNLDRAVSDGRTDLVFAAARAMSGNSSRSAAVTPLYNSDGVVQNSGHSRPGFLVESDCCSPFADESTESTWRRWCSKCALSDLSIPTSLLSYEQAGFRKREECVGQVVSLVDIIQRRQNAGLNTHVLFIDIRKAFDTVPVGALLWKLQKQGIPSSYSCLSQGTVHIFICSSKGRITTIGPIPGTERCQTGMSIVWTAVSICSSTTFSMVLHPSQSLDYRETPTPSEDSCTQDDVAVFADSEQSLLAASTAIEQWANRWEMQFGVAKCGIISFTGHLAPRT
ncbi:hypothetical protein BASA81_015533 [Batrachochytrium salamandrivorans]|nr:hypothetical protein BASA81_015533 [Batrachochytrium salamandrivorans]